MTARRTVAARRVSRASPRCAARLVLLLLPLLAPGSTRAAPVRAAAPLESLAGAAGERQAGGRPNPVTGLATPDVPLGYDGRTAATMEGARGAAHGTTWRPCGARPPQQLPCELCRPPRRLRALHAALHGGQGGQPNPRPQPLARPLPAPCMRPRPDLVLPYGYPLETYPVEAPGGFVLRVYRIPRAAAGAAARPGPRPAVVLHHGITLSSAGFAVLGPADGMAFYLADAGARMRARGCVSDGGWRSGGLGRGEGSIPVLLRGGCATGLPLLGHDALGSARATPLHKRHRP